MTNSKNSHVASVFPVAAAYEFLEAHGFGKEVAAIRASREQLGSYTTTLRKAKMWALMSEHHLLDKFIGERLQMGQSQEGQRFLKKLAHVYERYKQQGSTETIPADSEDENSLGGGAFSQEAHLRDYLADHLGILEKGLELWPIPDGDAVEFPINGRRIDILARDKDGNPVVIELKVSRGHERTVGQSLYYRAKLKEILPATNVRIIIVAETITSELRLATKEVQGVSLFEYSLSMTVKQILG